MTKTKAKASLSLRQIAPHEWVFEGRDLSDRDMDRFHAAIESLESDDDPAPAVARFEALLAAYPDDIDVRHHLALVLQLLGRNDEALEHWTAAVAMGMNGLPPRFYFGLDRIEWGWLQNRPFLRACHGLAAALLEEGVMGEAVTLLANVLDLNPNDNQGVRNLLARCWFDLRRPGEVHRLSERYPGAGPELMYGRALAHLQLGQSDAAEAAFREASSAWPRVHRELLKSRHTRPPQAFPGYITVGGEDQAYAYWEEFGPHWKGTRGALALARRMSPEGSS